jgi:glycosyltransferase involved in cell wall biosynthesis
VKVSVVTACFNSARTIADTIGSVASQSHREIEHILVDGGSTDGTLEVIASRRASIAKLIPGPDDGIYDALNKGLAQSSGNIVGFLHADDVYADDRVIEDVVREFSAQPLEAVYGNVAFVRGDDLEQLVRVYRSERFRPSRIAWGWMPAHPALFLARSVFEKFGRFKTDYAIAADFEFVARTFPTPGFRYRYLPKVLVKMRMGGISTQGWRSTLTLNQEVLRACRENGISTNYFKILSKYPAKALEFLFPSR